MANAIGQIIPLAVGVAISPLPIMAVILILFTPKARSNGPTFLLGWVLGMAIVSTIVLLIFDPQDYTKRGPTDVAAVFHMALGVLLLVLGFRRWRGRPGPGEMPTPPKWMARIATMGARQALVLAVLLAGLNPKNAILTISASVSTAQAQLAAGQTAVVMAIYVVIASVTIGVPVGLLMFAPQKAGKVLENWRTNLALHGVAIGVTLFAVFGALLIGKGIAEFV